MIDFPEFPTAYGPKSPDGAPSSELISRNLETFALDLGLTIECTPTSLTFPEDTTPERWEAVGALLAAQEHYSKNALFWYIGDWLRHGETYLGDAYTQALDATGWDEQTLYNCKWVTGRVPPERRRASLSAAHHAEVAGLPPSVQERLLALAVSRDLTRDEFRKHIRDERLDTRPSAPPSAPAIKVSLTVDGLETTITQLLTGQQQEELVSRLVRDDEGIRFTGRGFQSDSARRFAPEVRDAILEAVPVSQLLAAAAKRIPAEAPGPYTFKLAQLQKWAAKHEEEHPEEPGAGAPGDDDAPPSDAPPALQNTLEEMTGTRFRLLDVPEGRDLAALEPEFGEGQAD